jgi:hypothetical protein
VWGCAGPVSRVFGEEGVWDKLSRQGWIEAAQWEERATSEVSHSGRAERIVRRDCLNLEHGEPVVVHMRVGGVWDNWPWDKCPWD